MNAIVFCFAGICKIVIALCARYDIQQWNYITRNVGRPTWWPPSLI